MDIGRVTSLEAENLTLNLRVTSLGRLVEEQGEWLRRQSALLASQRQLIEVMAVEQDAMRDRLRGLEDRTSLVEFATEMGGPPSPRNDRQEDDDEAPEPEEDDDDSAPQMVRPLTSAEIDEILRGR